MVWVKFNARSGALVESLAADPGTPGPGFAVRVLDLDFSLWTDNRWDPATRNVKPEFAPAPTGVTREEFYPLLQRIAADVAAIKVKTDRLP